VYVGGAELVQSISGSKCNNQLYGKDIKKLGNRVYYNGCWMIISQSQTKVEKIVGHITNTFVLNSVFDAYIGG